MLKDQEHIFYLVGFDLEVRTSPPTVNPHSCFILLFINYNIIIFYALFIYIIYKYNNILYIIYYYYYLFMSQAAQ